MKGLSWKAILLGALTDLGSTQIFSVLVILFLYLNQDQTLEQVQFTATHSLWIKSILYGLGALASLLGGYVGAWIAKRREVLHGALTGIACVAIGLYSLSAQKWAFQLVLISLSPLLGACGGYLRRLRVKAVEDSKQRDRENKA